MTAEIIPFQPKPVADKTREAYVREVVQALPAGTRCFVPSLGIEVVTDPSMPPGEARLFSPATGQEVRLSNIGVGE
ncbi:MAG TPA: hypothetical protein VN436_07355 [Holophaga sp.]|nr:hypothetical protein [Holophaga sp.]